MATEREQLLREKLLLPSGPVDRDKATPEQLREYELLQRQLAGDKSLIEIDKIKVGRRGRFRKGLGDIADLVESIRTVGLLHPIVVDSKRNLIAGERRLTACKRLEWLDVPVRIIDLDEGQLLRAQQDENTVRKNFTPTEMVAIKRAVEDKVKTPHGGDHTSEESKRQILPLVRGKTIDKAAAIVGTSPETLRKAEAVVTAAEADPKLAPIVEEMDRTGKVDPAYRKVKTTAKSAPKTAKAAVEGLSGKAVAEQITDEWRTFGAKVRERLASLEPGDLSDDEVTNLQNSLDTWPDDAGDMDDAFSRLIVAPDRRPIWRRPPTPLKRFEDAVKDIADAVGRLADLDLTNIAVTREHVAALVADSITLEYMIDGRLDKVAGEGRPYFEIIGELRDPRLVCDACEEFVHESDVDSPLYECGGCGERYTRENSADGDSNRCPDCNKFGAKVADYGCPECGAGELVEQDADDRPEPTPLQKAIQKQNAKQKAKVIAAQEATRLLLSEATGRPEVHATLSDPDSDQAGDDHAES